MKNPDQVKKDVEDFNVKVLQLALSDKPIPTQEITVQHMINALENEMKEFAKKHGKDFYEIEKVLPKEIRMELKRICDAIDRVSGDKRTSLDMLYATFDMTKWFDYVMSNNE